MVKIIAISLFLFLYCFPNFNVIAQNTGNINEKRNELSDIKEKIAQLEQELDSKKKAESESLKDLDKLNQQNLLLSKLINRLKKEENEKQDQINALGNDISVIKKDIKKLTDSYSKYIVWVYKNRGAQFWKYILDSESFNQALIRLKYLNYITKKSKDNLDSLGSKKEQLTAVQTLRKKEVIEKEKLEADKKKEQTILLGKKNEKNELVKTLRKDKRFLNNEIREKRNAETEIRNMISRLIESERIRKTKEKEQKLANTDKKKTESLSTEKTYNNYNYDSFENFSNLKGKLNWPVKSGKIVRKFGENKNERLKTVTLNYGIDIKTSSSTSVSVVAEGIVSAIDWIPGFGSVIIITHKNDFRTVYGHVGDISINEGDRVKRGTVIGSVNESLEGNILHFEIWNDRNYQNPEGWLSR
ncbi:MAG: peptidoglycan DD-metalloendopeptidase family protein [bacterium]